MGKGLNIQSIGVLTDLQYSLAQFSDSMSQGLQTAENEIRRIQEWIKIRENYWQREVQRARQDVERARINLSRCEASGYRDKDGYYHPPDCSSEIRILSKAESNLRTCEENLNVAKKWHARLENSIEDYHREVRRFSDISGRHTERARSNLGYLIEKYERVRAAAISIGGMEIFVGAIIGLIGITIGRANYALGSIAEDISEKVIEEELAFKVLKFDQKKHGIDRILQTPSGQIVVLESKLNSAGKLALKKTRDGNIQGSAQWVSIVAHEMTRQGSELWSPVNESIGRQILEAGPENIPVLASVVKRNFELADIYMRIDNEAKVWNIFDGEIPIESIIS
jgi:hypothetical protein